MPEQVADPRRRRGLPRTAGGPPWPLPTEAAPAAPLASAPLASAPTAPAQPTPSARQAGTVRRGLPRPGVVTAAAPSAPQLGTPVEASASASPSQDSAARSGRPAPESSPPSSETVVRRGLPRRHGDAPWPTVDRVADRRPRPAVGAVEAEPAVVEPIAADNAAPSRSPRAGLSPVPASAPAPTGRTEAADELDAAPTTAPRLIRGHALGHWAVRIVVGAVAIIAVVAAVVLGVRALLATPALQDFLASYPGEAPLPDGAPVGLPAWLGWQHFFNVFLMVLIIRSGLQVRHQERPPLFWSPRGNASRKISITLWFHQSLDILWLANGAVFVVLLVVTGQWMRVVPTSWEVLPNALSAALQYASLDWPTENGWVNYNSLQVLAYFATIFLAAPLAALSGVRMSGIWPSGAARLNRIYPVEVARAIHFPVMLYFVGFIIVHVTLVFATGALRNLNHMYAAQGSTDPAALSDNWTGFWLFVASTAVIVAGWFAARPFVLAGIARAFGRVSDR
ncbi:cytochrome b/b6 domain-containing protein [Cnuibacter physcomitrellae]|uniref:cytochrome b/b6 domain-containing protein n=1 Tax=Cnuibacter physcomitrellae TaxID=1619308 RepID=UPI00217592D4|nr:cytochrome b/b6 domain-containing protein [Cnuibacter physcomitrellae]MCS5498234.1 cytochrome b/b6 domain-containing protein [Cnuibacter physcomitrellae]